MAQGVEHYKETEKGRETMCDAVKEYAKEYAYEREMDTKKRNGQEPYEECWFHVGSST